MAKHQLVELSNINPKIQYDIRYATANNFLGQAVYSQPCCYLHHTVALAVDRIQKEAEGLGLSIKVFDGYRPLFVQQQMWDAIQDERYVSNPAVNKGRHTRGTAIDLTLTDHSGNELVMPTPFDDFSECAHHTCMNLPKEAMKNRALLKSLMEKHGFSPIDTEWWHYDFCGWHDDLRYPPLNLSFEELSQ